MIPLAIPSPPEGAEVLISLGPLEIRSYAIAILTGIFVGLWWARRRWVERGGAPEVVEDIALWAIPFGIIGGRIYHVISSGYLYFGGENWWEGTRGTWIDAFKIWEGGLGIWGAIAFGALGAYIACRRKGVSFVTFMDAAAPGILLAQAIGRLGNYFNQERFGAPTTLPWGLVVDPSSPNFPREYPVDTLFHPTFLYEILWSLAGVVLIIYLERRFRLSGGQVFWLYVMIYTSGRLWIETVRIDEAALVGGVRINVWVSIAVLALAAMMYMRLRSRKQHNGEPSVAVPGAD